MNSNLIISVCVLKFEGSGGETALALYRGNGQDLHSNMLCDSTQMHCALLKVADKRGVTIGEREREQERQTQTRDRTGESITGKTKRSKLNLKYQIMS